MLNLVFGDTMAVCPANETNSSSGHEASLQVRQSIDIVDVVGGYLPLERKGHVYAANCPWHKDTLSSLQVNPTLQFWKCWVCDIGGDIFDFVMQKEGVDSLTALRLLAKQANIDIPDDDSY